MALRLQVVVEECRRAARTLWRRPVFAITVLLLLTVTIGTVTALGTAAYELLQGALPYGSPERLMLVWSDRPKSGYFRSPLSGPEVVDFRERSRTLAQVAAITPGGVPIEDPHDSSRISVALVAGVTRNFFGVMGAKPHLGRVFAPDDEKVDNRIVLSWASWQNRFGGDPHIIGRQVRSTDGTYEVIGVMPPSFAMVFPPDTTIHTNPEAWYLLQEGGLKRSQRVQYNLRVVARLRDDATPGAASEEIRAIGAAIEREFAGYAASGRRFYAVPLVSDLAGPVQRPAGALIFIGAFLVLLAYVNLAALWVARMASHGQDVRIQLALGASAARLRAQLVIQAVMLSVLGCVAGLVAGMWGLSLLKVWRPPSLFRIDYATMHPSVVLAVIGIVAGSTLLLALVAQASVTRLGVPGLIRDQEGAATRYRMRSALVVAQVALVLVSLGSAVLWTRSFLNVLYTDPGFQPDHVLTFKFPGPPGGSPSARSVRNLQLREAIAKLPGVEAAGTISHIPFDRVWHRLAPYGLEGAPESSQRDADARIVSPGFLRAIGARLRSGRFFDDNDGPDAPKVVIVDRLLAERTWPNDTAVGKQLRVTGFPGVQPPVAMTVIGVVEHIRVRSLESEAREQIYFPVGQQLRGPYAFLVRTSGDPAPLMSAIRDRVKEFMGSNAAIWDVRLLRSFYDEAAAERRFTAMLLVGFAAAALVLATIGIYGLLAYVVAGRRREFAVRMALGAERTKVARSVLAESLQWAAVGMVLGGAAMWPLTSILSSATASGALYGVSSSDPLSWGVAVGLLIVTVIGASWLPAFRASRTDPALLMKSQ